MKPKLRYFGDPVLRERSEEITEITDEIKELARFMIDYIDNNNGIGLSAVQMGVPIRLFILRNYVEMPDGTYTVSAPQVFINPKITPFPDKQEVDMEGCMSLPGIQVPVPRPIKIKIEATDLNGQRFTEEISGLNARVRMHENDHLNGVLTIDRTSQKDRRRMDPELQKIKKLYQS